MTAIWKQGESEWQLLSPAGFPKEEDLHRLVERAPHLLPLSGTPQLVVLGKEVFLGGNYADLIAIEPSGRLTIIEIKLANNAEARRAIIAQILTYAAYLRGVDIGTLEKTILGKHLSSRGYENLEDAAKSNDQQDSFDATGFATELESNLAQGAFRLVLVLDEAPDELVQLVGYLEAVANMLTIDLVTVAAYNVGETQIVVPQRVDPERIDHPSVANAKQTSATASKGQYVNGAGDFVAAIEDSAPQHQALLRTLADWAVDLEAQGLIKLGTYHGTSGRLTLLPRLHVSDVGLITIWNDNGPYISLWRSVFEKHAPQQLPRIEHLVSPTKVGQGTTVKEISDDLLSALADAYRDAASGQVTVELAKGEPDSE